MNILRALIVTLVFSSVPAIASEFTVGFGLRQLTTPTLLLPATSPTAYVGAGLALQTAAQPDWVFGDLEAGFAGRQVSTRLLLWSLPWAGAGVLGLWLSQGDWQKGFWGMSGAWAVINGGIALAGLIGAEPMLTDLRTILFVNAGLDVLYMAAGIYLMNRSEATWQGAGLAVLIQGGFLLAFDLLHALLI
jgi:hypothetical protein